MVNVDCKEDSGLMDKRISSSLCFFDDMHVSSHLPKGSAILFAFLLSDTSHSKNSQFQHRYLNGCFIHTLLYRKCFCINKENSKQGVDQVLRSDPI